jgi:anti-sigma B factor antagonist
MQLKITTRTIQEIVVLNCDGRIVLGDESAALRDTVRELLGQSKQLVLNLGGVSYIDSGGLGTLVSLYTTAHNAGASIKLSNLTQRVGDLLQVTKLLTIFEVYETEEEAIQSFRKGAAA